MTFSMSTSPCLTKFSIHLIIEHSHLKLLKSQLCLYATLGTYCHSKDWVRILKTLLLLVPMQTPHSTIGGYTQNGASVVTVLAGAIAAANNSGNAFTIRYSVGACLGATPGCSCPHFAPNTPACGIEDESRIPEAKSLAANSDLTILVLGDSSTILAGDSK